MTETKCVTPGVTWTDEWNETHQGWRATSDQPIDGRYKRIWTPISGHQRVFWLDPVHQAWIEEIAPRACYGASELRRRKAKAAPGWIVTPTEYPRGKAQVERDNIVAELEYHRRPTVIREPGIKYAAPRGGSNRQAGGSF